MLQFMAARTVDLYVWLKLWELQGHNRTKIENCHNHHNATALTTNRGIYPSPQNQCCLAFNTVLQALICHWFIWKSNKTIKESPLRPDCEWLKVKLQGRERKEEKSFIRDNIFFCFLNLGVGGGDSKVGIRCATRSLWHQKQNEVTLELVTASSVPRGAGSPPTALTALSWTVGCCFAPLGSLSMFDLLKQHPVAARSST